VRQSATECDRVRQSGGGEVPPPPARPPKRGWGVGVGGGGAAGGGSGGVDGGRDGCNESLVFTQQTTESFLSTQEVPCVNKQEFN